MFFQGRHLVNNYLMKHIFCIHRFRCVYFKRYINLMSNGSFVDESNNLRLTSNEVVDPIHTVDKHIFEEELHTILENVRLLIGFILFLIFVCDFTFCVATLPSKS